MQNSSKKEVPPIPETFGSENASPTESNDLINENQSSVPNHVAHGSNSENYNSTSSIPASISGDSFKDLSPTEEYLQMTKRLIESNILPPRTIMILKDLYVRYKSIKGYGPSTSDVSADVETLNTSSSFGKDKSPLRTSAHSVEDATADLKDSHSGQEEKPSASGERETLLIDSRGCDKLDHQKKRKSVRMPAEEAQQHQIRFEADQDYHFGREWNSEVFEINNIFSDFSFNDVDQGSALKRRISYWVMKRKESSFETLETITSEGSQSDDDVEGRYSNQNVAQETVIQKGRRLFFRFRRT